MTTTEATQEAPEVATEGHPEVAEALAHALARIDRGERARARRKATTPEQRARWALRSRLKACGRAIDRLAAQVEAMHSDRSGGARACWAVMAPPVDDGDLRGASPSRPRLLDQWERIEREAASGCVESVRFVEDYGLTLRLALQMRHERPPKRAADYDPAETLVRVMADRRRWIAT